MLNIQLVRAGTLGPLCGALVGAFLVSAPASAQPRRTTNNDVIVYADPNFHGASRTLRGDTADLRPVGLNDMVSSIVIPAGQSWEVCQDINYQTTCQTLTGSVSDLRTIGWDDRISSLRRVDRGFGNGDRRSGGVYSQPQALQGLVFYDRVGYRGNATSVTGEVSNRNTIGNRTSRSVEVHSGTWQVCDRAGRCSTVSQSVSDLAQIGLNGQIISVRPVNDFQDGRRRDDGQGRDRR